MQVVIAGIGVIAIGMFGYLLYVLMRGDERQ